MGNESSTTVAAVRETWTARPAAAPSSPIHTSETVQSYFSMSACLVGDKAFSLYFQHDVLHTVSVNNHTLTHPVLLLIWFMLNLTPEVLSPTRQSDRHVENDISFLKLFHALRTNTSNAPWHDD